MSGARCETRWTRVIKGNCRRETEGGEREKRKIHSFPRHPAERNTPPIYPKKKKLVLALYKKLLKASRNCFHFPRATPFRVRSPVLVLYIIIIMARRTHNIRCPPWCVECRFVTGPEDGRGVRVYTIRIYEV